MADGMHSYECTECGLSMVNPELEDVEAHEEEHLAIDSTAIVPAHKSPFDAIRRTRADGTEFWSARDLQDVMEYTRWGSFKIPLDRAIQAAENQGHETAHHFQRSLKVVRRFVALVLGGLNRAVERDLERPPPRVLHDVLKVARRPELGAVSAGAADRVERRLVGRHDRGAVDREVLLLVRLDVFQLRVDHRQAALGALVAVHAVCHLASHLPHADFRP